ncbi:hypothetical protein A2U01_0096278, partial [Trifolium medium]|nr:hypothetical protein [Trifolium medium]
MTEGRVEMGRMVGEAVAAS